MYYPVMIYFKSEEERNAVKAAAALRGDKMSALARDLLIKELGVEDANFFAESVAEVAHKCSTSDDPLPAA